MLVRWDQSKCLYLQFRFMPLMNIFSPCKWQLTPQPATDPLMTALLRSVEEAAKALSRGELVAIPTETVYGLAANAFDSDACLKIFEAKGRPRDNPLIVHVSDEKMAARVAELKSLPSQVRLLMKNYWPGPMTLLLPRASCVPDSVTCGLSTVAVRIPSHPIACALIERCGFPLAAPSANRSGRPSPTTTKHVLEDLDGRIAAVLDGGQCTVGVESTIIDVVSYPPAILRPGGISLEQVRAFLPDVVGFSESQDKNLDAPRCPGTRYRHYAPTAPLFLCTGSDWREKAMAAASQCKQPGFLGDCKKTPNCHFYATFDVGENEQAYATNLFSGLRELDAMGVDAIISQPCEGCAEAIAVMDRLKRAAAKIL